MNKGIVFDIQRFSLHDGPGIRTTVFLKGCPLRCMWCHNPESWKLAPEPMVKENGESRICGREMTADAVIEEVLADRAYYENSGGGLTVSGGEPMLQLPFLLELLKMAKAAGIHTCLETSGYCERDSLDAVLPFVDLFLFDIKETDPERHREFTGVDNRLILQNLEHLHRAGADILLRCPIIPGLNDSDGHIATVAALAREYPNIRGVEIMPYHDMGKGKWKELGREYALSDKKTVEETQKQLLLEQFQKAGCRNARI